MISYQNFIGIDMGKDTFFVCVNDSKTTQSYANTSDGIALFMNDHGALLPTALCVVETTGGYELSLVYSLCQGSYAVHRAVSMVIENGATSVNENAAT